MRRSASTVMIAGLLLSSGMFRAAPIVAETRAEGAGGGILSLESSLRLSWSRGDEYVYDGSRTLSYLSWPALGQPSFSARLNLGAGRGPALSARLDSSSPGLYGHMEDFDWLDASKPERLTNYSRHDNIAQRNLSADLRLGWGFLISPRVKLAPFLGIGAISNAWSARDGYYQYDTANGWSEALPKVGIYGLGIQYEQLFLFPALGLDAGWRPVPRLSLELSLATMPWVGAADLDEHFMNEQYDDKSDSTLYWGSYAASIAEGLRAVELETAVAYQLFAGLELGLRGSYRRISGIVGDVVMEDGGIAGEHGWAGDYSSTWVDGAGLGFVSASISLFLRVTPR